ncbi:hypothetical protein A5765_21670 [Mycolicibacterium celeriflavum]|nr:hypothetical protein A5765_21670 [Mycolicibacterium celeriflavum]
MRLFESVVLVCRLQEGRRERACLVAGQLRIAAVVQADEAVDSTVLVLESIDADSDTGRVCRDQASDRSGPLSSYRSSQPPVVAPGEQAGWGVRSCSWLTLWES